MKTPLNDQEHFAALQEYYARHRVFPSYARLMTLLGLASKSAVKKVLERLESAGLLTRTPEGDWAPADRFFERTLALYPVTAGMPAAATDEIPDEVAIDRYLVKDPAHTVLIRIKGDSMIDAGIHDGDLAVVERRNHASSGTIVVAVVDDEFTLKTLARDKNGYFLSPANPNYPLIRPKGKLEIYGVLAGLVRKYS